MIQIFFVREETTYGPFFSSHEKATDYLRKKLRDERDLEERMRRIIAREDPYISIASAPINDTSVRFDG